MGNGIFGRVAGRRAREEEIEQRGGEAEPTIHFRMSASSCILGGGARERETQALAFGLRLIEYDAFATSAFALTSRGQMERRSLGRSTAPRRWSCETRRRLRATGSIKTRAQCAHSSPPAPCVWEDATRNPGRRRPPDLETVNCSRDPRVSERQSKSRSQPIASQHHATTAPSSRATKPTSRSRIPSTKQQESR